MSANLNTDAAVEFTTEDGIVLRSAPLALAYFDPASGESVTIAELHDVAPTQTQTNEVVYADAFQGLFASVRYRNLLDGIHQDIVLHEAPPRPEKFGLSAAARLEVFTEFSPDIPEPKTEVRFLSSFADSALRASWAEPDFTDEILQFGTNTTFGSGSAFYKGGNEAEVVEGAAIPVGKRLLRQEGRSLLIEAVEHGRLAPLLKDLPQAAVSPSPGFRWGTGAGPMMAARRQQPSLNRQLASNRPYPEKGFVIDYEIKSGSVSTFTFATGVTYYVSSTFTVGSGALTIQSGSVIKMAANAGVTFSATLNCPGTTANPPVFTSMHDNKFGEIISGSTGSPFLGSGAAYYALAPYYPIYAPTVQNLLIRWVNLGG